MRLLVAPVAAGQADAADVELARHPGRPRRQGAVEHVEALVGHRPAVGDARPGRVDLADRVEDRPDRRLGGAAEARSTHRRAPGRAGASRSGRPTGIQSPDSRTSRSVGRQRLAAPLEPCSTSISSSAGTEFQTVTRCARASSAQRPGSRPAPGVGQHHGAARRRAGRRCRRPRGRSCSDDRPSTRSSGTDREAPVDVGDGVERAAVLDHHPLGLAGRAGGEDHVGEVPGALERRQPLGGSFGRPRIALLDGQRADPRRPLDRGRLGRACERQLDARRARARGARAPRGSAGSTGR